MRTIPQHMCNPKHSLPSKNLPLPRHSPQDINTIIQTGRKWLLTHRMQSQRCKSFYNMDMHLIQHSNKHRVDALEFRIAVFDLSGFHPFSSTELILDEVFPVFELLMRQSRAIAETPDVFPPELRSLERTGLAYCDDL